MIDLIAGPVVLIVASAMLVLLAVNLVSLRRHRRHGRDRRPIVDSGDELLVSVLIPARNEAECIVECVRGVLGQVGVPIEVIVLDDSSEDETYALVSAIDDPRLTVVAGRPLPDGWTGKNWACHQLAARATGQVLCFVDADTRLEPTALCTAVDAMESQGADLLSCLVAAEYRTGPQAVLLPMVNHALLALFPIRVMHSRWFPRMALALGPFLLIRAAGYAAAGGHAARPREVVDDVKLCRAVKAGGGRVRLLNGTALATTRWYPDTQGIWEGFSKNAFGALESSTALTWLTSFVLVPLLTLPFLRLGYDALTGHTVPDIVLVQVVLILAARLVTSIAGRDPLWSIPLHPVAVVFWGATLLHSAWLASRGGSLDWRGREVQIATGGSP